MDSPELLDSLRYFVEKACNFYEYEVKIGGESLPPNMVADPQAGAPFFFHYTRFMNKMFSLIGQNDAIAAGEKVRSLQDADDEISQGWLEGFFLAENSDSLLGISLDYKNKKGGEYPYSIYVPLSFYLDSLHKAHEISKEPGVVHLDRFFSYGATVDGSIRNITTLPEALSVLQINPDSKIPVLDSLGFSMPDSSRVADFTKLNKFQTAGG